MTGTTESGKKAAETRGHDELSKAGREGGKASHGGEDSQSSRSQSGSSQNKNESSSRSGSGQQSQDDRSGGSK